MRETKPMPKKLTESEILAHLSSTVNWQRQGDKISKKFRFNSFAEAFGFMSSCAIRAEAINHHPEWSNVYNVVSIDLTTHDVNGLSDLDFRLAQEIDALAEKQCV